MNDFKLVKELGIVPVIQIPDVKLAKPLAKALMEGGVPLIEVMFRNDCAMESIRVIKEEFPHMCAGAGTVLSVEAVERARDAGADFIVAPGFNEEVVKAAMEYGIPILPGCVTPSEIERGMKMGLHTFKFFPARTMGGTDAIRELSGPYPNAEFVVTGGMEMQDIPEYLSFEKIIGAGGGFMAPEQMIREENWEGIKELCNKSIQLSLGFHLSHVGINGGSPSEGVRMANRLSEMFGIPVNNGEKSVFAGSLFDCTKGKFPGRYGHIAMGTRSVERAAAYLKTKGIRMREEFKNQDNDGTLKAVYLEEEIGGFAIHLLKDNLE